MPIGFVEIPARVERHVWTRVAIGGDDECWPCSWSTGTHGYGQIGWWERGRNFGTTAHRVAWTHVNGPIPAGMTVDHICRNQLCCNPTHLRLLTNVDNARDNRQAMRGKGRCSYKEQPMKEQL